jgi:hypothetical protein
VLPAITEVEDEVKFITERHSLGQLHARVILDDVIALERIRVHEPDPTATGELELMQVRQIPSREPLVDHTRQPPEGVRRPDDEDPARRRLQPRAMPADEINPNLKPRPRHRHRTLRDRS